MNILMLASDYRLLRSWADEWLKINNIRVESHRQTSMLTTLKSGDTISWVHADNIDRIRGEVYDLVFIKDDCRSDDEARKWKASCSVAEQRLR